MNLKLRELIMNDVPIIASVYVKAYAEGDWNEKWDCEDAVQRINEIASSPQCKGGVCELEGRIVGCILFEILTWHTGKQLEIKEIFVAPAFQRRGIGKRLLEYAETCGSKVGTSEMFLWTNKSKKLIDFYSKVGYCEDTKTIQLIKNKMEVVK